jgi:drug/metabolite transporter (DMT)-like permease
MAVRFAAMQQPAAKTINLLVALICLLWGSTWFVIRVGIKDLPPFTSSGIRFAIAGVLMAVVAMTLGRRESGGSPRTSLWIQVGVLNFAVSYGIVYCVEIVLPSGLVAVLWGVFPMMMAGMAHRFLPGEQLRGVQWLGFAVGLGGIVFLFLTDLKKFGVEALPAASILLLSPLACAISTTFIKKHGATTNSTLLNRNAMLLGAALLLLLAVATEHDAKFDWTPPAIFSIIYLAVFGTVVTFGIYFWLLRYADANRLALVAYVTPVIALIIGWIFGEAVTWNTVLGSALIIAGVVAVMRGKRKQA